MEGRRLVVHLSTEALDFIDAERHKNRSADTIEALFIERAALLHDLLALNVTAEQLGAEPRALNIKSPYKTQCTSPASTRECACSALQLARITRHMHSFQNQSEAIEHLVAHVKYLRATTENLRFECARKILNRRIIQTRLAS